MEKLQDAEFPINWDRSYEEHSDIADAPAEEEFTLVLKDFYEDITRPVHVAVNKYVSLAAADASLVDDS